VAELAVLVELCLPFVRVGGRMIAQKKAGIDAELRSAGRAISSLGGRLLPVQTYHLPDLGEPRWLVVVEKVAPTPARYPRRTGVPAKKPL
jgi:16S rRNA (guanine527-N7)-methyltransferase